MVDGDELGVDDGFFVGLLDGVDDGADVGVVEGAWPFPLLFGLFVFLGPFFSANVVGDIVGACTLSTSYISRCDLSCICTVISKSDISALLVRDSASR